jgi:GNAT superfamily N-acetyltransferase
VLLIELSLSKPIIEKLSPLHPVRDFDCGKQELNLFLFKYALENQRSNSSQTYVAVQNKKVIGCYSLSVGAAEHHEAPTRIAKGLAKHPIPLMILTRLAVDKRKQGTGIGKGLLKNALLRTVQAADIAGIRAMIVHAKDEEVKTWYRGFYFEQSPTDPLHLYLLMKDIKKAL